MPHRSAGSDGDEKEDDEEDEDEEDPTRECHLSCLRTDSHRDRAYCDEAAPVVKRCSKYSTMY